LRSSRYPRDIRRVAAALMRAGLMDRALGNARDLATIYGYASFELPSDPSLKIFWGTSQYALAG